MLLLYKLSRLDLLNPAKNASAAFVVAINRDLKLIILVISQEMMLP